MRLLSMVCLWVLLANTGRAQTPVPMYVQPSLTYIENFDSIADWSNGFLSGFGANRFGGLLAQGTATIPDPTRITHRTDSFRTSLSSGGVQKGTLQSPSTQSILLLATGTTNNTNSAAIDFYMDFTGVDAGTVSFDWNSLNNSTGNRTGTFKLYATIDGTNFTELTGASVTITNNAPTFGSVTNVPLPASFHGNANARLRLYYYNSTGGSTGSRPKFNIDNWKITAVPNLPCSSPLAQPTNLAFGTITDSTIAGNFTGNGSSSDEYLVIASTSNSLTSLPVDGQIYNVGDNVGDGTVMYKGFNTSFTASGLNELTTYYFFIFAYRGVCTGGPDYLVALPLTGNATTVAAAPPCVAPVAQGSALNFSSIAINSITGSFTPTTADQYLVLQTLTPTLSANPVNGVNYTVNDSIGNAKVVQRSNTSSFTASSLLPATTYYYHVISLNSVACSQGPVYNLVTPLTGNATTLPLPPCNTPGSQPSDLILNASTNLVSGTFNPVAGADNYLVVRSLSPTLSSSPVDNIDYNPGDALGGGTVVTTRQLTSFLATGLSSGTTYYIFVFAANKNCSGGTKYLSSAPLTGNIATQSGSGNQFYFGNIHSHSDYSDGNQDNPGFTPTNNYNYALTSQCMDFLGISEHNHYTSVNNPGTLLSKYHDGANEANLFNSSNPNFVALYGMEWGVISSGGHVLIYGNGMDNLWGWETNVGGVPGNNYDVFVQKNDYAGTSGLYRTINANFGTGTFASLAHPNSSDFNNVLNSAYNASADSAISCTAVESGPATSTNTTYSDPASSMNHLWYYLSMLSRGYRLGAIIDHDNHNTTFGRTTYSRTGVVAPSLSKANVLNAHRNMNVYATQDCDIKVDFSINTFIMGSQVTGKFAPNIYVKLTDATTSLTNARIRLMFGVPGSGIWATKIDSAVGSTLQFTDLNLANLSTGYYYLDILNGTSRIITSPIWYTRSDGVVIPVTLSDFAVQKQNDAVKINWTTEQEINSDYFIVQHSVDGINWTDVLRTPAAGNRNTRTHYEAYHTSPVTGYNYYRLKQFDRDGKSNLSVVRSVLFNAKGSVVIGPNPAQSTLIIRFEKQGMSNSSVDIINEAGSLVKSQRLLSAVTVLDIKNLPAGVYFIRLVNGEDIVTRKFIKMTN